MCATIFRCQSSNERSALRIALHFFGCDLQLTPERLQMSMLPPLSGLNVKASLNRFAALHGAPVHLAVSFDDALAVGAKQITLSTPPQPPLRPPEKEAQSEGVDLGLQRQS
jgi:hypothetical protein